MAMSKGQATSTKKSLNKLMHKFIETFFRACCLPLGHCHDLPFGIIFPVKSQSLCQRVLWCKIIVNQFFVLGWNIWSDTPTRNTSIYIGFTFLKSICQSWSLYKLLMLNCNHKNRNFYFWIVPSKCLLLSVNRINIFAYLVLNYNGEWNFSKDF